VKVLLVHPYRLGTAGLTTFVLRLQEGLRAKGCEALVLVGGDSTGVVSLETAPDIFGIYLRRLWPESARLKGCLAFWAMLPITLWQLWRFLRRERVDIVHLHFTMPASLYFVVLHPVSRWKLLATFHGTDGYALSRRSRWHRLLVRWVVSRVDLVTAVSGDLLRTVQATFPSLRAKARVILNGTPLIAPPDETPAPDLLPPLPDRYVLAVGSLIPRKAYDVLVKAMALIRDRGHHLDLVIVGDGPEAPRLATLAKELAVEERVLFAGEMPHAEVLRFYPGAEFFVHTAREEAFGLVLLEAMAFGKAVIAPRVGGVPEFVRDGQTGLLVKPDDPAGLAEAMIRLHGDELLRDALAARGHDAATKEHSWERVVDAYQAMYHDVLRGSADIRPAVQTLPPAR
jgi:glycosyltransferase involved in cell wall biosynthesis